MKLNEVQINIGVDPGEDSPSGIVCCSTYNLGDDIQTYAVSLLMPVPEYYVNRESISNWVPACKVVMAGWYKHLELDWPPHENIIPLFLAFHAAAKNCISEHIDYLAKWTPIGCRDLHTVELCRGYGLEAYFSGCVTLTLRPLEVPPLHKPIFIDVTVPEGIDHAKGNVWISGDQPGQRLEKARQRLEWLASASCVVTSRLHVALPCAAMGVPVLLIPPPNDGRFSGLLQFVNHLEAYDEDAIRRFVECPMENPNPGKRMEVADEIRRRVAEFYEEDVTCFRDFQIVQKISIRDACGDFTMTAEDEAYVRGPIQLHGDATKFAPWAPEPRLPATGVLTLEGGGVLGNSAWVVDSLRNLVVGLSWYGDAYEKCIHLDKMPVASRRKLKGRALNLGSTWSSSNYAHCLLESIGRLSVLEATGASLSDFDYILLPYFKVADIETMIDWLGIDRSRLIHRFNPAELLVFDQLVTPTMNGLTRQYRPELVKWARKRLLLQHQAGSGRRLFIRRQKSRIVKNSKEIERIALSFGFEIVDPALAINMFLSFNQAECIVGAHQAAFANLMFANEGSRFLELLPTSHQYLYFQDLACSAGVEYHCMLADSDGYDALKMPSMGPSLASVMVNPDVFVSALEAITQESSSLA